MELDELLPLDGEGDDNLEEEEIPKYEELEPKGGVWEEP